jgi:hypothetical protein
MARPIGVKSYLKAESVENGASNRSKDEFSFDIHLNMARPIGAKVCLGFIVN